MSGFFRPQAVQRTIPFGCGGLRCEGFKVPLTSALSATGQLNCEPKISLEFPGGRITEIRKLILAIVWGSRHLDLCHTLFVVGHSRAAAISLALGGRQQAWSFNF